MTQYELQMMLADLHDTNARQFASIAETERKQAKFHREIARELANADPKIVAVTVVQRVPVLAQ